MQKQLPLNDDRIYVAPLDRQVAGNHYKDFAIQPVEFCELNLLPYCMCNIIKYVVRHKAKNGRQDLEKASHYCELAMAVAEKYDTSLARYRETMKEWNIPPTEFIRLNKFGDREAAVILHLASVFEGKGLLGYLEAKKEIDLLLKEEHYTPTIPMATESSPQAQE